MIEQQLAARMLAAVDHEPPLGFDPDEIAGRARRRRRQRGLALTAVAATVTVFGIVAAVVIAPNDHKTVADPPSEREVVTCGDVDFDGSAPRPYPDAQRDIDRLNREIPKALADHFPEWEFKPVLDGMRRRGCSPSLMGTYRSTDAGLTVLVRLSHKFDELSPGEGFQGETRSVKDEFVVDGSLVRVYRGNMSVTEIELPGSVEGGTRHDRNGFVAEVFLNGPREADGVYREVTVEEMGDLLTDPILRF
ncbi:hypothetical protein [Actinophytocola sediminis]